MERSDIVTRAAPVVVAAAALLAGCNVALRSSSGGAFARPGVAGGTTNSVYVGDRGGLFTRLGFGLLGGMAAAGAVRNVSSTSSATPIYDSAGDRVGTRVTTVTTGTVDPQAAAAAQALVDDGNRAADAELRAGAVDPTQNYASWTGGLEIASRSLGGDTSGWMFDFGAKAGRRYGVWGLRWSAKIAFGKLTFHDRMVRVEADANASVEDSTYTYLGVPLRLGVTYRGLVEVFGQLDLNVITAFEDVLSLDAQEGSPSAWRVGARVFAFRRFYAEAGIALSTMRRDDLSSMLEAGVEF